MRRWTIKYIAARRWQMGGDGLEEVLIQRRPVRLLDWLRPVPLFLQLIGREWDEGVRLGIGLAWDVACGCAGIERSAE